MNLIVGATGLVGGEICRRLAAQKKPVRALVRPTGDASRLEELRHAGAELASGDLKDPASIAAACAGATTVLSTASSVLSRQPGDTIDAVDRVGQLQLVEAAKAAGAKHFVYVSFPPMEEDFALQRAKRQVEQAVIASGMTYTILRPTVFMEVWLSATLGFDVAARRARIYGTGESPISWISFPNVAEFAERSLETPAAHNATLTLGGPEALSPNEVVRIFEELGGAPFTVEYVLETVLHAAKAAARRALDEAFASLSLAFAQGCAIDMHGVLEVMPVRLVSVREYAAWLLNENRLETREIAQ
ncbi:MAG TPA: SDR family oxidoreductase [Bryobacteraceae bacterium]|nr:SDR family oxidoreductase [Bryobacteraceae bacterium]